MSECVCQAVDVDRCPKTRQSEECLKRKQTGFIQQNNLQTSGVRKILTGHSRAVLERARVAPYISTWQRARQYKWYEDIRENQRSTVRVLSKNRKKKEKRKRKTETKKTRRHYENSCRKGCVEHTHYQDDVVCQASTTGEGVRVCLLGC